MQECVLEDKNVYVFISSWIEFDTNDELDIKSTVTGRVHSNGCLPVNIRTLNHQSDEVLTAWSIIEWNYTQ